MRPIFLIALFLSASRILELRAQDVDKYDPLAHVFPYLTFGERLELRSDFLAVTKADPDLKSKWTEWLKEANKLVTSDSSAHMEAFRLKTVGLEQRFRLAMSKDDPHILSVMDKIDQNMPLFHPELRSLPGAQK